MSDKKKLIKSVLIGSLCGMLACVILMCVMAAVMLTAGLLPAGITDYAMAAIASAGALTGGFVATKLNKGAGLIVGALTGAAMFLLITLAALLKSSAPVTVLTAIRAAGMLAGGAIGGILGLRERKKIHF
ncbi:MAG: TIGR04086 family membrane protein [Ruminococcus sp.]